MASRELVSIQILRAVAAISVVFYHVYVIGNAPNYFGHPVFGSVAKPGLFGVNLFFVLSGFIILRAHTRDIGHPSQLGRYVKRRFSRIYPIYWFYLSIFILAAIAGVGAIDEELTPSYLLTSYSLVSFSGQVYPPLKVAWTLFYEMRFYVFFAIMIASRGVGLAAFCLWLAYIIFANATGFSDVMQLFSLWNLHFFIGMLVCLVSDRMPKQLGLPIVVVGLLAFCIGVVFINPDMGDINRQINLLYIFAPIFGLIVLGSVLAEETFKRFAPPLLKFLGDASYSIYLVHSAIISIGFIILNKVHLRAVIPDSALYLIMFVGAVLAGTVAYVLVEKPTLKLLRGTRRSETKAVAYQ